MKDIADQENELVKFINNDFNWKNSRYKLIKSASESHRYDFIKSLNSVLTWRPKNNDNVYDINSMGYRSDEFIENREMVFSGCSQTFGVGVLNEGVWGNMLSKKLNLDAYNLALGGKSTQFIVQNLIAFFKEYGNPKFLFCLFPEFIRIEMKSDLSFMTGQHVNKKSGVETYNLLPNSLDPNKYIKYSKAPHIAEDIIPSEFLFSINLDYIRMLELYCKLNNIILRWGTWDELQDKYLKENINTMDFENYVYMGSDKWEKRMHDDCKSYFHEDGMNCYGIDKCTTHTRCHEDIRDLYGDNFDFAMDLDIKNKFFGHMPIHRHAHVADYFERSLNVNSN